MNPIDDQECLWSNWSRRQWLAGTIGGLGFGVPAALRTREACAIDVEPLVSGAKTIKEMPRAGDDLDTIHKRQKGLASEQLPAGEAFEINTFTPYLTLADKQLSGARTLIPCIRKQVLSVGLEEDQADLPLLSKGQILSYLKEHFVSVQVRIYREPLTDDLYLGARPLASTMRYAGVRLTQDFTPAVAQSADDFRGLGLWLGPRQRAVPTQLRTLVLINKNEQQEGNKERPANKTMFEYLFIRATQNQRKDVELHAFATTENRSKLHWLETKSEPSRPTDCSLRAAVRFTRYSVQGLIPEAAVTRRSLVKARETYAIEDLDRYANKTWNASAFAHLTDTLDAVLAGKIAQ
jgi:hypothetical protein